MAIAKVIEVISSSTKGIEDAVSNGIAKASETVQGIEGAADCSGMATEPMPSRDVI